MLRRLFKYLKMIFNRSERHSITSNRRSIAVGRDIINSTIKIESAAEGVYFQELIDIIRPIQTTYRVLIQRFFEHYLGTSDNPAPFGGRDEELDELTRWLSDSAASPVLLITGPAGRGKTALVIKWMCTIGTRCKIVFVPISIRFQTNHATIFYESLATQLAAILDVSVGHTQRDAALYFRDRSLELIHEIEKAEIKTLLVFDGLDEAVGWTVDNSILRKSKTDTLRVLVSARTIVGDNESPDGWLSRLDWPYDAQYRHSMVIRPLLRDGIKDVLQSLGPPTSSLHDSDEIIAALERLTGGDPLLIRMYAERLSQLSDDEITPDELAEIAPGLEGYFTRWFAHQSGQWTSPNDNRRETLECILSILSVSLSPLLHHELEAICCKLSSSGIAAISSIDLEPLRRFILGDGLTYGYSFQHPRFAQYFRDSFFKRSTRLANAKEAIIDWGKDVARQLDTGLLPVKDAPPYALLNLTHHLVEAPYTRTSVIQCLLREGWQRAWFERDADYSRYSTEINTLLALLAHPKGQVDEDLVFTLRVKASLILSSINTLGTYVPTNLIIRLVEEKRMSSRQGLKRLGALDRRRFFASLSDLWELSDDEVRSEMENIFHQNWHKRENVFSLIALAHKVAPENKDEVYRYAISKLSGIRDEWRRAHLFEYISNHLNGPYQISALRAAREIQESGARVTALTAIAKLFPLRHQNFIFKMAMHAAEQIAHDPESRSLAHHGAVVGLFATIPEKFLQAALDLTEIMEPGFLKEDCVCALAPKLSDQQIERTLDIIEAMASAAYWSDSYHKMLDYLPQKVADRVIAGISQISNPVLRKIVLADAGIRFELSDESQIEIALRAIEEAEDYDNATISAVRYFSKRLATTNPVRLLTASEKAENSALGTTMFGYAVTSLPNDMLERALCFVERISQNWQRTHAIVDLHPRLDARYSERVLSIVRRTSPEGRHTLSEIVPSLDSGSLDAALTAFEGIGDSLEHAKALTHIATNLSKPKSEKLVDQAIDIAAGVHDDLPKFQLVKFFVEACPHGFTERLWALACSIYDLNLKLRAMVTVCQLVSEEDMQATVDAITIETKKLPKADQGIIIAKLARHLPKQLATPLKQSALNIAGGLNSQYKYGEILKELARGADKPLIADLISRTKSINSKFDRARVILDILDLEGNSSVPSEVSGELLKLIQHIDLNWQNDSIIRRSIRYLSVSNKHELGAYVSKGKIDYYFKALALIHIIAHSDESLRRKQINGFISLATRNLGDKEKVRVIQSLTVTIPRDLMIETIALIQKIETPLLRVEAYSHLARYSDESSRSELIDLAIANSNGAAWEDLMELAYTIKYLREPDISPVLRALLDAAESPAYPHQMPLFQIVAEQLRSDVNGCRPILEVILNDHFEQIMSLAARPDFSLPGNSPLEIWALDIPNSLSGSFTASLPDLIAKSLRPVSLVQLCKVHYAFSDGRDREARIDGVIEAIDDVIARWN
ncbi:ATP-binding protein [Rhizobium sp. WYCCWR 11146]|uniref:ATP-binding protein n=1 Tax=Rhizobium sp. WYCCWR 11146 TaxID=2749833 RepID=UPI0015E71B8A|nr:ATP-binding protein [Rhizobium sp. WYCCWR 11146]MBA1347150.1 ATP-binding protein [Rhizobium sp. WYCCWR 11146]